MVKTSPHITHAYMAHEESVIQSEIESGRKLLEEYGAHKQASLGRCGLHLESDPTGRSPKEAGSKLDAGKAPVRRGLLEYFPRACLAVATVSGFGADKYSWGGWKEVPDGVDRYGDAELRHVCKAAIEGEADKDSGLAHAAHEAWNALARLELLLIEKEKNNG